MTALAIYFCIADLILISQCIYYRRAQLWKRRVERPKSPEEDTHRPLLGRRLSSNIGLPGSRRSSLAAHKRRESLLEPTALHPFPENQRSIRVWPRYLLCVLVVCLIGTVGWAVAWQIGVWKPIVGENGHRLISQPIGALILGYLSAACYLGSAYFSVSILSP